MKCSVEFNDASLNIPIFAPNSQRLIKRPNFLSQVGGNLHRSNGKVYVQALRSVSFNIKNGEHLALIGHNGAGKSTLLKAIAGIYPITSGEVLTEGSVGCLFDVGTGITPEMTGFECIRLQHLIYGDGSIELPELIEDIKQFSELGEYLGMPIRTYSEGMKARLMAGLATAWKRDILLIDEGIGAGDAAFQSKMNQRVSSLLEGAGLLVIASHDTGLLRQYCKKAIVLSSGAIVMSGDLEEALEYYSK